MSFSKNDISGRGYSANVKQVQNNGDTKTTETTQNVLMFNES
jgi:hypothetical protein